MRFEILSEPFSHVIIHDVLTNDQLKNVWTEIDFLHPRLMKVGENDYDGGSAKDSNGNPLKQNSVLELEAVYNLQYEKNISYILEYLFNVCNGEALTNIAINDLDHYFKLFVKARNYFFKLQYYEDNDGYKPHQDESIFTHSLFLYKEPKNFIGGDFVFDEYDYTIECHANKMIMFPSTIKHSVTPVKMSDNTPNTGRYSITVFQSIS